MLHIKRNIVANLIERPDIADDVLGLDFNQLYNAPLEIQLCLISDAIDKLEHKRQRQYIEAVDWHDKSILAQEDLR